MKNCILIFPLFFVFLFSCEETADLTRTFVTQKGEHYSTPRIIETLQGSTLDFKARFNETARYAFEISGFDDSKNKLMGFSDCNSLHHQNSARFAWQWFNDRLEIFAYCYVNGERVEAFVGVVELNEFNSYSIRISDDHYEFILNDEPPVFIERGETCNTGIYYKLWPYFGGTLPAPHTVSIDIR